METENKLNRGNIYLIVLISLIATQCIIACAYFDINMLEVVVSLFTVFVSIEIPGLFITNKAFADIKGKAAVYSVSFFIGFALIIPIYYLSTVTGSVSILWLYTLFHLSYRLSIW